MHWWIIMFPWDQPSDLLQVLRDMLHEDVTVELAWQCWWMLVDAGGCWCFQQLNHDWIIATRWCPPRYKLVMSPLSIDISPINHSYFDLYCLVTLKKYIVYNRSGLAQPQTLWPLLRHSNEDPLQYPKEEPWRTDITDHLLLRIHNFHGNYWNIYPPCLKW